MPAANPLADVVYNSGVSGGLNAGTTVNNAGAGAHLSSGQMSMAGGSVGGNANVTAGALVAGGLLVLLAMHILGFRGLVDASVGRR